MSAIVAGGWGLYAWSYNTGYTEAKDAFEQRAIVAEKLNASVKEASDWQLPEHLESIKLALTELKILLDDFEEVRVLRRKHNALEQDLIFVQKALEDRDIAITEKEVRIKEEEKSRRILEEEKEELEYQIESMISPIDEVRIEEHSSAVLVPGILTLGVNDIYSWRISGMFGDSLYEVENVGQLVGQKSYGRRNCHARLIAIDEGDSPKSALFSFQCVNKKDVGDTN